MRSATPLLVWAEWSTWQKRHIVLDPELGYCGLVHHVVLLVVVDERIAIVWQNIGSDESVTGYSSDIVHAELCNNMYGTFHI